MYVLLLWGLLCTLTLKAMTLKTVDYSDESSLIVVPVFLERDRELVYHFRFPPSETKLIEKWSEFCSGLSLTEETSNKVLTEAQGRLDQWWKYEATTDNDQSVKYYHDYILGVPSHEQNLPLLKTNYCFVTAFYDLGRSDWQHGYERSAQKYLLYFSKLLQINIPLIVFIDDRYYSDLTQLINQFNYRSSHIVLIRINERFLEQHIRSWQYLSTDEAIMASSQYRASLSSRPRPNTPETLYPRYTCFTHAKMDFVMFALTHQIALTSYHSGSGGDSVSAAVRSVDYLGWIDFGYLHHDSEIIPFEMNQDMLMRSSSRDYTTSSGMGECGSSSALELDYITERDTTIMEESGEDKDDDVSISMEGDVIIPQSPSTVPPPLYPFHMMTLGDITAEDGDPLHTLKYAPVKIQGSFMFGHTTTVERYSELYHRSVSELHSRGIADDEQAIMAHLYWKEPGLFKLWRNLNLIEPSQYLGWYSAHILYNKRMAKKKAVRLYYEVNKT